MIAARVFYDAGNSEAAREMLGWVIDNAGDPSNLHLARVRLAYLEVGEGNPERALELLQVDDENGFTSHYAEIRGDAQVSLGDPAAARQSYEQALAALPATSTYESVLRAKRNSVAGAN